MQAILGRKLVTSEIYELMHKVCELSVKSDSEYIRQQCRQVCRYCHMIVMCFIVGGHVIIFVGCRAVLDGLSSWKEVKQILGLLHCESQVV